MHQEFTLVTGASGGIGYELAIQFARHGSDLILTARRQRILEEFAHELQQQYKIRAIPIAQDLSLPNSPETLYQQIQELNRPVTILVNNAGFGDYTFFPEADVKKTLAMLQLNISSLTHLTRLIVKDMLENAHGKIMNVASIAAFQPGPLMAAYYASKAYVLSFSQALDQELKEHDIRVSALCPGVTLTGFQQASELEDSKLMGRMNLLGVMTAHDVAEIGYRKFMKNKRIIVPGFMNRLTVIANRFFSRRFMTRMIHKIQEAR